MVYVLPTQQVLRIALINQIMIGGTVGSEKL